MISPSHIYAAISLSKLVKLWGILKKVIREMIILCAVIFVGDSRYQYDISDSAYRNSIS